MICCYTVILIVQVHEDNQVTKEQVGQQEMMVPQDLKVMQGLQDQMDPQVLLVQLEMPDLVVTQELQAVLDLEDLQVQLDSLVNKALGEILAAPDLLETMDNLVHLVIVDHLDPKDHEVDLARLEMLVSFQVSWFCNCAANFYLKKLHKL